MTAEVEWIGAYPVVVNHPAATERLFETPGAYEEPEPSMGGEDFAFYGQVAPACFFFLGLRPDGASSYPNLHAPNFDFNDDAIQPGVPGDGGAGDGPALDEVFSPVFSHRQADRLRWGILATGGIARQFASGLPTSKTGTLHAVGSRTIGSATAFTEKYGGKPYGSYDEVLADPDVDAVYIATPHHLHAEWTIKTAQAGKAILCEKPFTLNALEAERALAAVKEAGVFFMEAFHVPRPPADDQGRGTGPERRDRKAARGERRVRLRGGPRLDELPRRWRGGRRWPDGRWHLLHHLRRPRGGEEASEACYKAEITEKGYDAFGSGALKFPNGMTAAFSTGIHANLTNDARIYGESGSIHVPSPWKCSGGNGRSQAQRPRGRDVRFHHDERRAVRYRGRRGGPVSRSGRVSPHYGRRDAGDMRTLDKLRTSAGCTSRWSRRRNDDPPLEDPNDLKTS